MLQVEKALGRGIAYLRSVQAADGSFSGHSSPQISPFKPAYTYRTAFMPALILGALGDIEAAQRVRQPLAAWVKAQCSPAGSFNYWAADAPERQSMPYPDDLDDTFCALLALYRHDPNLVDAAMLGAAVKILVAAEQQVGGPYRTWLVGADAPAAWQDVDLAVNSNIAGFLRLVAEPLPNLTALMDQAITSRTFTSPYYPSAMPVLYYVARAYTGEQTEQLAACIKQQRTATPLDSALRLCALLRLGHSNTLEPAVKALVRQQRADGSWPEDAFCLDAAREGRLFYHGSEALTTAFALEALDAYARQYAAAAAPATIKFGKPYTAVITAAKRAMTTLDSDLQAQAIAMVDRMAAGDVSQEIILMPQLFAASLVKPPKLPAAMLQQLSLANLFGWIAYTIYDDFLDNEGQPVLLPVANAAMRKSLETFAAALPQAGFQDLVKRTFDAIDSANAWEVTHCRFTVTGGQIRIAEPPRYGKLHRLAERSLGHTLTPLAILTAAGYAPDDPKAGQITLALHHYLIARQLQDDLYDWDDDFRAGRITAVVAEALRSARVKPGAYSIAELVSRMQRQFWPLVLPLVCTRTEKHLATSRKALRSSGLLLPDGAFYGLLDRLETVRRDTRAEQSKATDFLAAYKKPLV